VKVQIAENKLMPAPPENKLKHARRGQPCVYKAVTCAFDGACAECKVWKQKEIEMLKEAAER
jgi:hypothetical protein